MLDSYVLSKNYIHAFVDEVALASSLTISSFDELFEAKFTNAGTCALSYITTKNCV
jgi:hypothetical protein